MSRYILLLFDEANHLVGSEALGCTGEVAAMRFAMSVAQDHPAVELWTGSRRIARLRRVLHGADLAATQANDNWSVEVTT